MNKRAAEKKVSDVFSVLGNPFRIRLMLAIGDRETCVCHLEAMLKKRQAFISQHLMALREAGLLETRRDGKYIFYRIASPEIFHLIGDAAKFAGIDQDEFLRESESTVLAKCVCPHCAGDKSDADAVSKIIDATSAI